VYQHNSAPYCQAVLESALALAAKGISVFPLKYRSKKPDTRRGFYDATTNPATIKRWFGGGYERNLGARCGRVSGTLVFDADNLDSLKALEDQYGALPLTLQSQSSRGRHFWFKAPFVPIQSSKSRVGSGLDIQSDGNYVVAPPSIHPDGPAYSWLNDAPIVGAPSWLLVLARKPTPPQRPPTPPGPPACSSGRPNGYGLAALRAECGALAAMLPNTGRNHQLNRAAFCMFQLVAGGELNAADVERALFAAATTNGLVADDGEPQCRATIRSGASAGILQPRSRNGRGR
jgi:hypothetical protein